jgi:hypothetical protein
LFSLPDNNNGSADASIARGRRFRLRFTTGAKRNRIAGNHFALFANSVSRKKIPLASTAGQGFMVSNKKLNRRASDAGHLGHEEA